MPNALKVTFDVTTKKIRIESDFRVMEVSIGEILQPKDYRGVRASPARVDDFVDDMVIVTPESGKNAGKRRLVEVQDLSKDFVLRVTEEKASHAGRDLGAHPKGKSVETLITEQRETNRLLRLLCENLGVKAELLLPRGEE